MKKKSKQKFYGHVEIPLKRVHLELTNVCDFNCTFCPKSIMKRAYGFIKTDLAKQVITELSRNNICDKITFHVMGEPTLHPDFFPILEHAVKENLKVGLTTNGAGLGGKIGKRLCEYDLHQIDISLQTPNKASFKLRKPGKMTFKQYLDGILSFYQAYHVDKKRDTIFKFRLMNTRFSKKDMEEKIGQIRIMSSTRELRDTFKLWAEKIYNINRVSKDQQQKAFKKMDKLKSYQWNVVEIYPNVFFETYILEDWGNTFTDRKIYNAWAGYCFGMRDHFAILHNGDVCFCCVDYDGRTAIGNLHRQSLKEILSSPRLAAVINGFKHFRVVHSYCKRCLGSKTRLGWLIKPILTVSILKMLKPFFYRQIKIKA